MLFLVPIMMVAKNKERGKDEGYGEKEWGEFGITD